MVKVLILPKSKTKLMRTLTIFAVILTFQGLCAQESPRQTVEAFFESFHKRDTLGLKKLIAPEAVFHSISVKKEKNVLSFESLDEFYKSIGSFPKNLRFEEKLTSWTVNSTGEMANVWTDYEFYIDGKRSHGGVNSFQLYKAADGWKIVHIADTRKR